MSKTIDANTSHVFDDWLAVSTDGFAAMNAGREPAHLVKELVQNAFDAVGDAAGEVVLTIQPGDTPRTLMVSCRDNGHGIDNLSDIRTVFHTSKTDSHLQRGRMGRGFKEMLCLADWAEVRSGPRLIGFIKEDGKRLTREEALSAIDAIHGTLVQMQMPWSSDAIPPLLDYFGTLLVPSDVRFIVNDRVIPLRPPTHLIDASLPTELLEAGRWVRPSRRTTIELVPIREGESATVYELGLPVCPVEWTRPYHANVQQRVPMNPGRDAVASGYLLKLHKSCLPFLLAEMDSDQVRQDWVGNAAPHCATEVQKEIVRIGFGENIARSVPKMGARQFDEDARDIGIAVVDTRQTSGGFREILQEHVPTTRQAVDQHNRSLVAAAAAGSIDLGALDRSEDQADREKKRLIEAAGGVQRVQQVMEFARWFCQELLIGYADSAVCSVTVAPLKSVNAIATWGNGDVLTLGIDTPWLWSQPIGEETLTTLIHEAAHHLNAHHGRDFHKELEKLAGRAACLMLAAADLIKQRYNALLRPPQ